MSPTPDRVERVLQALHDHARPAMLEYMRKDSCIAATRIGIDVLEYFGIKAEPLPLFVMVLNGPALEMLAAGTTLPEIAAEAQKRSLLDQGGPWTIGLGAPLEVRGDGTLETGKWAGHLVIAVPQYRTLVDLSIDQISRPWKEMVFGDPVVIELDESSDPWWAGEQLIYPVVISDDLDNPVLLILDKENRPDPDGYKATENWRRRSAGNGIPFSAITGDIIRRIKAQLEAA